MPNLLEIKDYIFDKLAFGYDSQYPSLLSEPSQNLLKNHQASLIKKPNVNKQELLNLGLEEIRADLGVFLIENRETFSEIASMSHERIWNYDINSNWSGIDLINRYYLLTQATFSKNPIEIAMAISDIENIIKTHIIERFDPSVNFVARASKMLVSLKEILKMISELEIRKNARALIKSSETHFKKLPKPILEEIASITASPYAHNNKESLLIAKNEVEKNLKP